MSLNSFASSPKKTNSTSDRFLPENRSPQRFSPVSRIKQPKSIHFESELYESLVNGVHPDKKFLHSNSIRSIENNINNPYCSQSQYSRPPMKMMEVTGIHSDFYLHPLDWSANNVAAISLKGMIGLFSPQWEDFIVMQEGYYDPSALCFSNDANKLTVATSSGRLLSVDIDVVRIAAVHVHSYFYVTIIKKFDSGNIFGDIIGNLYITDNRDTKNTVFRMRAHEREICNIVRSPLRPYISTGSNDNLVKIWDERNMDAPLMKYAAHKAAVRAMDWSPRDSSIIVTAGGLTDKMMYMWDVNTGETHKSALTGSQTCNIVWNEFHDVLISSQGFNTNQIYVWNSENLSVIDNIDYHNGRILYMAQSLDQEYILSASPDGSCNIWNLFGKPLSLSKKYMFSLR